MCRMIGIRHFDFSRHRDLLNSFIGLGRTGAVPPGNPPGHLDGWGIGWYQNGKAQVYKSGGSVIDERIGALTVLEKIGHSSVLICHLRKAAWDKTASSLHAHPFLRDQVLFCHNGTILDYRKLAETIVPVRQAALSAMLDTEVWFEYMFALRAGDNLQHVFETSVQHIKERCEYTSLNSLLSDPNRIYAYRAFTRYPDYYSLYYAPDGDANIVCSEPVGTGLDWALLEPDKVYSW